MSKITVTEIAGQTSGSDQNLVKLPSNNTLQVDNIVNRGGDNDSGVDLSSNDVVAFKTANAERVRVDSSGNVGIGTSAPSDSTNNGDNLVIGGESNVGMSFLSNATSGNGAIYFADGTSGDAAYRGILSYSHSDDAMDFGTASTAARVRIDSNGTLLVNDTGRALTCRAQITYNGGSEQGLIFENEDNSASGAAIRFVDVDGDFSGGGIYYHDSNSINYQTTSDYRLKENIVTDWNATTDLKKLKPSKFNFKKTPSKTVQGFIAHEVSDIVPEAIIGVKDGTEKYIDDEDGKEKTREAYQSIDQSKLVPLLTKSLQEALARIETLETKVKTLESK